MNSIPLDIILMVVTITVGSILLYPLRRSPRSYDNGHPNRLAVYRDQLKELERDRLMGLFIDEQVEYVRAEIARRLFAANDNSRARGRPATSHWWTVASAVISFSLAFVLYLFIGRPGLPSHPFANVAQAVAQSVDGRDALEMSRAPTPARLDGLADTLIAIAGGVVTEDARKILEKSQALEPRNPRARFYIALSLEQSGKTEQARAAFEALAKESPVNAPWLPLVSEHIARTGGAPVVAANPHAPGVPMSDDIASGRSSQMIRGMVESLDKKLAENPDNFEGWTRLVRSYAVLNDKERAEDALKRGLTAFPASGDQGRQLLALAKELGIQTKGLSE